MAMSSCITADRINDTSFSLHMPFCMFVFLRFVYIRRFVWTEFSSIHVNDASNGGTVAWTNPSNAIVEDAIVAHANVTFGQYLGATGYGFHIPGNATILGIVLEVKRASIAGTAVLDQSVKLYKGGVISGTEHGNFSTDWPTGTLAWFTYGSATDLWGLTWTPADINSATFGSVFSAQNDDAGPQNADVDSTRITVYANLPPTTIYNGSIPNGTLR